MDFHAPALRLLGLAVLTGVATGCPGDDVTVGDETGGMPTSTGDTTPSTTAMTSGPTTSPSTTASTTGEPDTSSGGTTIVDTEGSTTEPDTTTGPDETTSSTGATAGETTAAESSSSSSTGNGEQDCPYGDLMVPDTVMGTTVGEDSEFASMCGGNGAPDVSYTLTAPADGVYVFDTYGSSMDTILAVYDGECGGPLLACNNDDPLQSPQSSVAVDLSAGQTVTVVVDSFSVVGGAFTLNVAFFEGVCPNGDLGSTVPQSSMGSTMASDNTLLGTCGGGQAGDEAFTFTAPEPGIYTFDTLGSDFDTVLYVRDACLGDELACNDDGLVDSTSRVIVTLEQDEQVVAVVDGANLESGNYVLNIELDECPDADLGNAVPVNVTGSTVGLIDQADSTCVGDGTAPDVAYTFTAPVAETYQIDTEGSALDTVLYVYDGVTCDGTVLGCDDQGGMTGNSSLLLLPLAAGQEVTIIVDGWNSGSGAYNLNVDIYDSCGNGFIDEDDVCDGSAMPSEQTCEDFAFVGGVLDCGSDCQIDTSECSNDVVAVCSAPNVAIPAASSVTDTIVVPNMGSIADVDVFVDASHTWIADLTLSLSADDLGLTNTLSSAVCGSGDDVFAFYNDEGNQTPGFSCAAPNAIEGNLIPDAPLSVYDGSEVNGSWTLTATDIVAADVGTLHEWCLYFTLAP